MDTDNTNQIKSIEFKEEQFASKLTELARGYAVINLDAVESNMESMQLVPYEVNNTFKHYGGVAEYKAMIGQEGGADFD